MRGPGNDDRGWEGRPTAVASFSPAWKEVVLIGGAADPGAGGLGRGWLAVNDDVCSVSSPYPSEADGEEAGGGA